MDEAEEQFEKMEGQPHINVLTTSDKNKKRNIQSTENKRKRSPARNKDGSLLLTPAEPEPQQEAAAAP